MSHSQLTVYNSLSRKKEIFEPLHPPFVGMYVCGPTVYGEPHLGHARPYITFDIVFRYLQYLGFKVRYVRNITDVGHLEGDADEGEDKIAKKARLEKLEPMEIVQLYTNSFHEAMNALNTIPPSIEPSATGHIPEQIKMTEQILKNDFAYEVNGSIYFNVLKYAQKHNYGKLSGRVLDELMASVRILDSQEEKHNKVDFALWKKAKPERIMQWDSPWGNGFPGWHLECSVMSAKYLGVPFDIHGGGMDLQFPHHECEIAQSTVSFGKDPVRYWMHNNMITINGQKMAKSLGNGISLKELFTGENKQLAQPYSPMTVRFFILQTHYRSTLDFSNEALQAAEKGLQKLMTAHSILKKMKHDGNDKNIIAAEEKFINEMCDECFEQLNDDFNTAQVLATLFELSSKIYSYKNGQLPLHSISKFTFEKLQKIFLDFIEVILGLTDEEKKDDSKMDQVVRLLIKMRQEAKAKKDFVASDNIREELKKINIQLKDEKDGTVSWELIN